MADIYTQNFLDKTLDLQRELATDATNALREMAAHIYDVPDRSEPVDPNYRYVESFINKLESVSNKADNLINSELTTPYDARHLVSVISAVSGLGAVSLKELPALNIPTPDLPPDVTAPTVSLGVLTAPQVQQVAFEDFNPTTATPNFSVRNITVPTVYTPAFQALPTLSLPQAPVYTPRDIVVPSINLPTINDIVLPSSPVLSTVTLPTKPTLNLRSAPNAPGIVLPTVPKLADVYIPDLAPLVIPTFNIQDPTLQAPEYDGQDFTYREALDFGLHVTEVYAILKRELDSPLPEDMEDAIWAKARQQESATFDQEVTRLKATYARMGFNANTKGLVDGVREAYNKLHASLATISRDQAAKRAELYVSHREQALQLLTNIAGTTLDFMTQYANRALDAAKYAVQSKIDIFRTRVEHANLVITIYNAKVQAFMARLSAIRESLALEKARVEIALSTLQVNQQQIDVYRTKVEAAKTIIDIFNSEVRAFEAANNVEIQKLNAYRTEIDASIAEMQINKDKIGLYTAQVDAEMAPLRIAQAKVDIEKAKLSTTAINVDVERSKIDVFKTQIQARMSEIDAYRSQVQAVQSQAELEKTKAEVSRDYANMISNVELNLARLELDVQTKAAELSNQSIIERDRIKAGILSDKNRFRVQQALDTFRVEADVRNTMFKANADVALRLSELKLNADTGNVTRKTQGLIDLAKLSIDSQLARARLISEYNNNQISLANADAQIKSLAMNRITTVSQIMSQANEAALRGKAEIIKAISVQASAMGDATRAALAGVDTFGRFQLEKSKEYNGFSERLFNAKFAQYQAVLNSNAELLKAYASMGSVLELRSS